MTFFRLLILIFLVFVNGFFVAAEFAIVKIRMGQIEPLAARGRLSARAAASIVRNMSAYLSACQLGVTLASLGLGWIGEPVVAEILRPLFDFLGLPPGWEHYIALPAAFLTITFLHITVGEQAPKMIAIQKEQATALAVSLPLLVFYHVFRPFIWVIDEASRLILRVLGFDVVKEHRERFTADELRLMVAETIAGGELSRVERQVMKGVLEFEGKTARQIMVPRPDIVFLDTRGSFRENVAVALESGKTRFPLCDGNLDNVVGMVHARDLLKALADGAGEVSVEALKREVPFLPETLGLNDLLLRFQKKRTHMAVLLDEYGGVAGMVTLEDVLEELVGQIQDEFDRESPLILSRGGGRFVVDGKCHLDDLGERCGVLLPDVRADTAGGLVTELKGHIPRAGEWVRVGKHRFTVIEALPTHVKSIEIREIGGSGQPGPEGEPSEEEAAGQGSAG